MRTLYRLACATLLLFVVATGCDSTDSTEDTILLQPVNIEFDFEEFTPSEISSAQTLELSTVGPDRMVQASAILEGGFSVDEVTQVTVQGTMTVRQPPTVAGAGLMPKVFLDGYIQRIQIKLVTADGSAEQIIGSTTTIPNQDEISVPYNGADITSIVTNSGGFTAELSVDVEPSAAGSQGEGDLDAIIPIRAEVIAP